MPLHGKLMEVRDRSTFIPILAVRLATTVEPGAYYLRRAGYVGADPLTILVHKLDGGESCTDPADWGNTRTMPVAHRFIVEHWYKLGDGSVVDVEFILKETKKPKQSERYDR